MTVAPASAYLRERRRCPVAPQRPARIDSTLVHKGAMKRKAALAALRRFFMNRVRTRIATFVARAWLEASLLLRGDPRAAQPPLEEDSAVARAVARAGARFLRALAVQATRPWRCLPESVRVPCDPTFRMGIEMLVARYGRHPVCDEFPVMRRVMSLPGRGLVDTLDASAVRVVDGVQPPRWSNIRTTDILRIPAYHRDFNRSLLQATELRAMRPRTRTISLLCLYTQELALKPDDAEARRALDELWETARADEEGGDPHLHVIEDIVKTYRTVACSVYLVAYDMGPGFVPFKITEMVKALIVSSPYVYRAHMQGGKTYHVNLVGIEHIPDSPPPFTWFLRQPDAKGITSELVALTSTNNANTMKTVMTLQGFVRTVRATAQVGICEELGVQYERFIAKLGEGFFQLDEFLPTLWDTTRVVVLGFWYIGATKMIPQMELTVHHMYYALSQHKEHGPFTPESARVMGGLLAVLTYLTKLFWREAVNWLMPRWYALQKPGYIRGKAVDWVETTYCGADSREKVDAVANVMYTLIRAPENTAVRDIVLQEHRGAGAGPDGIKTVVFASVLDMFYARALNDIAFKRRKREHLSPGGDADENGFTADTATYILYSLLYVGGVDLYDLYTSFHNTLFVAICATSLLHIRFAKGEAEPTIEVGSAFYKWASHFVCKSVGGDPFGSGATFPNEIFADIDVSISAAEFAEDVHTHCKPTSSVSMRLDARLRRFALLRVITPSGRMPAEGTAPALLAPVLMELNSTCGAAKRVLAKHTEVFTPFYRKAAAQAVARFCGEERGKK